MTNSRRKGVDGERELATLLADLTGWDVRRRVRQHDGDSDLEGIPGWSIEVKRHARAQRADICAWWGQALDQAVRAKALPVLFFRQNRDEWRAVWPFAVTMGIRVSEFPSTEPGAAGMWAAYGWTTEASIEVWAAVATKLVVDDISSKAKVNHG